MMIVVCRHTSVQPHFLHRVFFRSPTDDDTVVKNNSVPNVPTEEEKLSFQHVQCMLSSCLRHEIGLQISALITDAVVIMSNMRKSIAGA